MDYEAQERLFDFFAWVEACPDVSRRENDDLTRAIAQLVEDNRDHPHLWFLVCVYRTVGDPEFIEDVLMPDSNRWPTKGALDEFEADYMCGRILADFEPRTASAAYTDCLVLAHLWHTRGLVEHYHAEDGDWSALNDYPEWGVETAPEVQQDLGCPSGLIVREEARLALNRLLDRPLNKAWTANGARAAVERIAAAAPRKLGLNAQGAEFALCRYEECRGWDDTDEDDNEDAEA